MYDSNSDGSIDFREFMLVLYVMSNGSPEENLKQVSEVAVVSHSRTSLTKQQQRVLYKTGLHCIMKAVLDTPFVLRNLLGLVCIITRFWFRIHPSLVQTKE